MVGRVQPCCYAPGRQRQPPESRLLALSSVLLRLFYRFESANVFDTVDPAAVWEGTLGLFPCALHGYRLRASVPPDLGDAATARGALEPLLRDWEALAFLAEDYEFVFAFEGSEIEGSGLDTREAASATQPSPDGIFRRHSRFHPRPDASFRRSTKVDAMLEGIHRYRRDAVELPGAGRAMLALLTGREAVLGGAAPEPAPDWPGIARALRVDEGILTTLAELSRRTAPGASAEEVGTTYRGPEWQWMQEVLSRLTLQLGRSEQGPPPLQLSMHSLATAL